MKVVEIDEATAKFGLAFRFIEVIHPAVPGAYTLTDKGRQAIDEYIAHHQKGA